MSTTVIVLGATGLVGRTMLHVLEEQDVPVGELRLLAGDHPGERTIEFRGRPVAVHPVTADAFAGADLALFACKNPIAQRWAAVARETGVTVVDNSSAFRYDDAVPLVVPEVNGHLLAGRPPLVANPNCSTIAIAMVLAPLARAAGLERVVVSTYQSVSGGGREALAELERGVRAGLEGPPPPRADGGAPFAYNVVPHIDRFESNGYSREEMKVVWETRKILGLAALPVTATAVRVPVRIGHGASINVTLGRSMDPDEARALWAATPGITVVDDPARAQYPTPLAAAGRDDVLVGRARRDISQPRGLECFVTSDNLRKGAATNAVQIAEAMLRLPGGLRRTAPADAPGARTSARAGAR
jgi:aspartate-semialdehyde dehydrogenase